ncbi:hypothetical protein Q8A67_007839 [Cirrhinus molitorella]|uniref:Ig-like domain-containing protein n=1 Tax=Cirrhinus molitorella TaxID=172907 RepID=A0AA88Q4Y3_9TELE|nr:hypothetical protein Q8A67_007839 [Cirrhinus molitorella]
MMKSFQLSHLQLMYLLIAALLQCEVATQRRCKEVHQLNINCVQGDSMSISCLTTTHPLQSLTVKLRRTNQDKDILIYPDIFPASEHQRWSVRKDAGNVTLDLKDIRLSDDGLYDCQIYKDWDCLNVIRFHLKVKECKTLDSVHPAPGSSVLLPCSEHPLQNRTEQVTWKVVTGHQSTNITQYRPLNKPSSSTEKLLKPLYERVRQLANGSLFIMDVVHTDELWYRCRVNEKTCYEVKLLLKDAATPADSTVGQTKDNSSDESETVTTNVTVVVMITIVSLCVLTSLTIHVILILLKKQRPKIDNQIELNCQSTVYYSEISGVATQRRCKQVHQLNINCIQGDNVSISCLTTTHPLKSLTVKLRRTNQDKDILMYPDISPASEHQRWSVRKDAENVTLDLKDISLFDGALYDCQVYKGQDCLNVIRFHLKVKECKILDTVNPTPGSSVLLPCSEHLLQNRNKQVTWQVVDGRQTTNISQYPPPNNPSSSTGKLLKPLYKRVRQLANGSLLIRDVVHTDELWYRCRVNEKTCYDVKLLLKAQMESLCKQVHQLDINHVQGDSVSISCLTTTQPLQSVTVKLRRTNQDKDILMYPDISPASEHQRWSVKNDNGNVTLDLKDIRLSDDGQYDCQVYKDQDCLYATKFNLKVRECKILNAVHAVLNSLVLLPCSEHPLQHRTEQVSWKVIIGNKPIDISQYRQPNKPSSSTEKLLKPLYERARQLANGSLLIRDAVYTDNLWYRCRVNDKTCYEVKLMMKASTDSIAGLAESNSDTSAAVTTNLTVVVMTTIMFLCVLISLTACVILYFQKRRRKANGHIQLNERFSVYYSPVAEGFDVPLYSLVERNTGTMTTFGVEQSEAPAFKSDDMYENLTL